MDGTGPSTNVYKAFGEVDEMALEAFGSVCKAAVGVAAKDPRAEAPKEGSSVKRLFVALAAFATDMARLDAGSSQVRSSLEELGVSDGPKLEAFLELFLKTKPAIRLALGQSLGVSIPKLVDVRWRLDYVVRSSDPDNANPLVPIYYLKLFLQKATRDTSQKDETDTIDLALSVAQMHDFLLTIRDANHQAARLSKVLDSPPSTAPGR